MWKDIPGWEDRYEVNECGEVRNKITNNLLQGDKNNFGYLRVCLHENHRHQKFFRHRLVATLFLQNPFGFREVNHKDCNKQNNHVSNLEWCDRTHNERESRRNGIKSYRPYHVLFFDGREKTFEFASQLAEEIGVTRRVVVNYLQGKSHGYISKGIRKIQYL